MKLTPRPIDTTVVLDHSRRTVRPSHADADDYYGLSAGSNGTAATARRATAAPADYTWRRHDGRHASGLALSVGPRAGTYVNPWTHELERTQ